MKIQRPSREQLLLALWVLMAGGLALGSLSRQLFALLGLLGLPLLVKEFRALRDIPEWRLYSAAWLLMAVPVVLAIPGAATPADEWRVAVRLLGYWTAGSLLFYLGFEARLHRHFVMLSGGLLVLLLIDGLAQWRWGQNIIGRPLYDDSRYGQRITGFLGVDYGWVMAVASPFVLEAARLTDPRGRCYWLVIPLVLAAVLLSGSRASMLLMLLGWCAYAALLMRHAGRLPALRFVLPLLSGAAVAAVLLLTTAQLAQRWTDASGVLLFQQQSLNDALSLRPALWTAALDVFRDHWLNGVGTQGFGVVAASELTQVTGLPDKPQGWSTHLSVMDVATGTGVIGLTAYTVLLIGAARFLWQAPMITAAPGLTALLAAFPLGATLPFYSMRVAGAIWLCFAMALVMSRGSAAAGHGTNR